MQPTEKNPHQIRLGETTGDPRFNKLKHRLAAQKEKTNTLYAELEEAIGRTNTLTMEAEITRLELEQIIDAISDAMWVISTEGTILYINATFLRLLGRPRKACVGAKCYEIHRNSLCHTKACPIEEIKRAPKRLERELSMHFDQGPERPYLLTAAPLLGLANDVVGVVEQYKDITQRKKYEAALEEMATRDSLTRLANRRHFERRLNHEWRRLKREQGHLSIIMCDIDFFKLYNDHYGHQKGDHCLKAVAACLKRSVRRPADLPARYGGEEFIIILPHTPLPGSLHVAESIRKNVQTLAIGHAHSGISDHVSLSLGVASTIPDEAHAPAELVRAADLALYAAKHAGRNRVAKGQFPPGGTSPESNLKPAESN